MDATKMVKLGVKILITPCLEVAVQFSWSLLPQFRQNVSDGVRFFEPSFRFEIPKAFADVHVRSLG